MGGVVEGEGPVVLSGRVSEDAADGQWFEQAEVVEVEVAEPDQAVKQLVAVRAGAHRRLGPLE